MSLIFHKFILLVSLITIIAGIELELSPDNSMEACTILLSTFDPVNVELNFPEVPNKLPSELFGIKLSKITDVAHQTYIEVGAKNVYRNTYTLDRNVPYQLCVSFNTVRSLSSLKPIYVSFLAVQNFQSLIGRVQIPPQLASEENLKTIYKIASQLGQVNQVIMSHQVQERKLEDQIVTRNVHKQGRIVLLGIIEVLIIILCGVYQVFALRKFLIQKNLY